MRRRHISIMFIPKGIPIMYCYIPIIIRSTFILSILLSCSQDQQIKAGSDITYQDIMDRVEARDQDSNAILLVRKKKDAPQSVTESLRFIIAKQSENSIKVRLETNVKPNT